VIENEDVDYFAIDLKKGQRLTAEVEGMRLATTRARSSTRSSRSSTPSASSRPRATTSACSFRTRSSRYVAPEDGTYVIQLRESAYGGDGNCQYRIARRHIPAPARRLSRRAGRRARSRRCKFLGDASGELEQTFKLPAEMKQFFPLIAEREGALAPSPNRFRVSPFANTLEAEPNDEIKSATPVVSLPIAMNGVIGRKGDIDFFKITAKKDQTFDFSVYARRVRSPLDPVLHIFDAAGKVLNGNDDNAGPDSYQRFTFPADGEYAIRVYDQLYDGGPEFVYRIEARPVTPNVTLSIPLVTANSQERQTIVVPRGNRYAALIRPTARDFGGDMKLSFGDLPKGVTATCDTLSGELVPVIFEAAADAPTAGRCAT
jgi:hypothetical protein